MRGHRRSDNVVADFCDSKHASSHMLWGNDNRALQVFLYYDEVELCNPLGASRKIHKLGMLCHKLGMFVIRTKVLSLFYAPVTGCFYFTIGNIHQKFRSTLKSIQLLALVKNEDLKKYGMNRVLQHIVPDITKLEEVCFYILDALYLVGFT